ncbi:MAG: class I SAM-dependent methyltransferase [Thermodesulfobacteriota bacterium]
MAEGFWRQASRVFDERAAEYDQWFEGSALFEAELAAIRQLATPLAAPRLEVGVGPGRFAQALGVEYGVDPALAPLRLARQRGVRGCRAAGEALPFASASMGTVLLLFTLCFLENPQAVLAECRRVLRPGGRLVVGHIVAQSPWGAMLARKKAEGHPFYQHARFYAPAQVISWLAASGLTVVEQRSGLLHGPDQAPTMASLAGEVAGAGLALLVAEAAGLT